MSDGSRGTTRTKPLAESRPQPPELYAKYVGTEFTVEDDGYLIFREPGVLAVLPD